MSTSSYSFPHQVAEHSQTLYPFAYNLTRNPDDAQDLIQETVLRSLVNMEKFADGTNLKAWLFTIMRNVFINNYRRTSRRRVVTDDVEKSTAESGTRAARNGGEARLTMKEIQVAMDSIDTSFSKPFMMHYNGCKYQEIADEMNLPLGTVKSRIFFARKALQKRITRY
jgi:RNA polymerase sigma-70 factor (ECF subfamily)